MMAPSMGSRVLDSVGEFFSFVHSFGPLAHLSCGTTWPVRKSAMLVLPVWTKDWAKRQASCASVSFVNDFVFSRNSRISSMREGLLFATYLKISSISCMVVAENSWSSCSWFSPLSSLPMRAREWSSDSSVSIMSSLAVWSSCCSAKGANWFRLAAGFRSSTSLFWFWMWWAVAATVVQSVPSSYGSLSSSSVGCMAAALRLFGWLLNWLCLSGVSGPLSSVSAGVSSRLLCFCLRRRLVNATSRLVWLEEVGVAGSWLFVGCLGGVAATAARVGRRMLFGKSVNWRMVLVVSMCVSGVLRRYRV